MKQKTTTEQSASTVCYEMIETKARERIQSWLQDLLEEEVTEFLGRAKSQRRSEDNAIGYRNGYGTPRRIALSSGTVSVRRPRLRNLGDRFESRVLPLFKRRSQELGELLPRLYLHGLSSGDFELALRGLLGEGAPLSATSLQRLKGVWQAEYERWKQGDLSQLELVYWWADGLYVKAGIADRKAALLVIVGALSDGRKVLLACQAGERESKESWLAVLRELKARGLKFPKVTVADGHLGIWAALGEVHPGGDEQRCWNHKIVNVLDQLPKKLQAMAREQLCAIPYAESRREAVKQRDAFAKSYRRTHPRAVEILENDWDRMVAFFDFPKEHWKHLRTTNPIESTFATVKLRSRVTKGAGSRAAGLTMTYKLLKVAEASWRRLDAHALIPLVRAGVRFVDGKRHERDNDEVKSEDTKKLRKAAA